MTIFEKLNPTRDKVTGVGSALVDILARQDEAFIDRIGGLKGGMTYVDKVFIDQTVTMMDNNGPQIVPGGSACNTVVGIGRLGGQAQFVGKCGTGEMGQFFRNDLNKQGVVSHLFPSDTFTGRVLSIVTPDAQRSMFTFLGASAEIQPDEVTPDCFGEPAIVHIEGYLLFNRELIQAVLKAARQAGALVSLDLASFNVVEEAKDILPGLVEEFVDILIANEDEALAFTGLKDEDKALERLAEGVDLAVLKLGARGSMIAHDGQTFSVNAKEGCCIIDTTGAGDLWASGFLYGLVNRMPLHQCANLGSVCGFEVCQVMGACIPDQRWIEIRKYMEAQWPKGEPHEKNS